jgi:hypothetical protein
VIEGLGIRVVVTGTVMESAEDQWRLASDVLTSATQMAERTDEFRC